MESNFIIKEDNIQQRILYREQYKYFKYFEFGVFMVLVLIIMILFAFQISESDMATAMRLNRRIKRNLQNLEENVIPVEKLYTKRIQNSRLGHTAFLFSCLDIGTAYLPVRINPDTTAYEGIRRGNGDIWSVFKNGTVDEAAKQFCEYIIMEKNDNTIACGQEMYRTLGYPGYTNIEHWCSATLLDFINVHSN